MRREKHRQKRRIQQRRTTHAAMKPRMPVDMTRGIMLTESAIIVSPGVLTPTAELHNEDSPPSLI